MEEILAKLPQSVLDYTDPNGNNIANKDFNPFFEMKLANSYKEMNPGDFLIAYTENIPDIVKNKVANVAVRCNPETFLVDVDEIVQMIQDSGAIRCLHVATTYGMIIQDAKSHIDFTQGPIMISSYYSDFIHDNTVILHNPPYGMTIVNDLIRLGDCQENKAYMGDVESSYIGYSSYFNLMQVEHYVCGQKCSNLQLYSRMAAVDALLKASKK